MDQFSSKQNSKAPLPAQFFWRNQPISVQRVKDILHKVRTRGMGWLMARLAKEFRTPETKEGIYVRAVEVWLYGSLLFMFSPLIFLAAVLFGQTPKTLYFFYDLDVFPITFDAADFLVLAELDRRRRGFERLYIVIVPGRQDGLRDEGGEYEKIVDRSNRLWRLNNLVIPLFALMPSCAGYSICKDRRHATLFRISTGGNVFPPTYWPAFPFCLFRRPILEAAKQGVSIFPIFHSPDQSLKYVRHWLAERVGGKKAVTITLRNYGVDPLRNSNLPAWAEFARSLNPEEFVPVFVLDTETAMDWEPEAIREFLVFREAPWNIPLRSALYELAYLNLSIVHGPTELLWYNDRCRYVIFFPPPDSRQTQTEFVKANGFVPGESLPFATSFQKWVWEPDDTHVIKREFDRMCGSLEDAAGSSEVNAQGRTARCRGT